ncbi:WecB/TagA/CpsF family glycosyltransferase [Catellatospora sp. KI3]|uniref:WecB/TagA/CpsF family glycosyltransferase n=1 Tax=Catellatospora sp. KI3 TaxID=3041620 RepID=UPI0024832261|nr:WecB/TagA/CpsF family glycosyltransferase [Catellatospora sp. KI3]MDI1460666.1 WecB/TagA/CpsF family glycosyltransferase [Catellatospora sp. KI3]
MTLTRQPAHPSTPAGTDGGKHNVLGVLVDRIDYDGAVDRVLAAARQRRPLSLTALAVHGVMTGVRDPQHRARLNAFDIVAPDGQPVRWALNLLHSAELSEWVSGPELTGRVLRRMAEEDLPVYLYGSTPQVVAELGTALARAYPALRLAGAEPSGFRETSPDELAAIAARINASGARLLLVGLGCPRQEIFVHAMRPLLDLPAMAVGAAFDYHAGRLAPAPRWMQRNGLAWLWRLASEPRRLWRRYLVFNTEYLGRLGAQKLRCWRPQVTEPTSVPAPRVPV